MIILFEFMSFIFFSSFFLGVMSMILVYAGRRKVKEKILCSGNKVYEKIFTKNLNDLSHGKALAEAAFFVRKSWPELDSLEIVGMLEKHRKLEIFCYMCFLLSFVCFFMIAILSFTVYDT